MSYTTVRERSRYRAEIPQEAWQRGRAPRERATRTQALDDLIVALARYLEKLRRTDPVLDVVAWTTWAARLSLSGRYGATSHAPDGSVWLIRRRVEYL